MRLEPFQVIGIQNIQVNDARSRLYHLTVSAVSGRPNQALI